MCALSSTASCASSTWSASTEVVLVKRFFGRKRENRLVFHFGECFPSGMATPLSFCGKSPSITKNSKPQKWNKCMSAWIRRVLHSKGSDMRVVVYFLSSNATHFRSSFPPFPSVPRVLWTFFRLKMINLSYPSRTAVKFWFLHLCPVPL